MNKIGRTCTFSIFIIFFVQVLSISLFAQNSDTLSTSELTLKYYWEAHDIFFNTTRYADAILLFEKCAEHARGIQDFRAELYALDHIAFIHVLLDDYSAANKKVEECFAKYAAIENNNDQYLLADLNYIKAVLLYRSGEHDQSIYYFNLVINHLKAGGEFTYRPDNVYKLLAFNYRLIGDIYRAVEIFQYGIASDEAMEESERATYFSDIAGCYIELNEFEKASEYLQNAKLLLDSEPKDKGDFDLGVYLRETANLSIGQEKFQVAKESLIRQKGLKNRIKTDINRLLIYGDVLSQQDSFLNAEKYYQEALSLCESDLKHDIYKRAQLYVKSGANALKFNNDHAIKQLNGCIDLLTHTQNLEAVNLDSINSHRVLIDALFNLSTAHLVSENIDKSEYYALQAFRVAKHLIEYSFVNPESKFNYVFYYRQYVSKILDLLIDNGATDTAYEVMAQSKSLLFRIEYDQINDEQKLPGSADSDIFSGNKIINNKIVKTLTKWNKKNNANLIDYFIYEDKLYIFYLTKNHLNVTKRMIETNHRRQITSLYGAISDVDVSSFDSILINTNELYQLLLNGILVNDKKQAKNLVIIPDEELHYLPFEILSRKSDKKIPQNRYDQIDYLLYDYDISYHFSSLLMTDDDNMSDQYSGFAPFNTENISTDNFSFLPTSEEEITYANQLFEGEIYTASSADTAQLFKSLQQEGILHLATHTAQDTLNENLNRLVFFDGMIGSEKIDSIACDLAVLSACKTAHGELKRGEGLVSLTRTVLSRGTKSALTSLWNVNDKSALAISSSFFDQLHQGANIAESLSASKRNYIDAINSPIEAHPYYWAGFINIGNHQLKITKAFNPLLWVLCIPVLLLLYFFVKKK